MKNRKPDIRPFTKQFYRGNAVSLVCAVAVTILDAAGALLVSWLIQQMVDLIGGEAARFDLFQLSMISLALIAWFGVTSLISYHVKPKFVTRGIAQYKEYVFGELTKKNIAAFAGESSATYISALTNDIQTIEQGYLRNPFTIIESLLTFAGAMVLMSGTAPC